MKIREVLERVPDPRGGRGRDYRLSSLLALIVVSLLCGRKDMMAAFRLGRTLTSAQREELGFAKGNTPCHATLTETLRVLDPHRRELARRSVVAHDRHEVRRRRLQPSGSACRKVFPTCPFQEENSFTAPMTRGMGLGFRQVSV
jgi:hypothetical protein